MRTFRQYPGFAFALGLFCFALVGHAHADWVDEAAARISHEKMVQWLDAIEAATPEENRFLGTAMLEQRSQEFQSLAKTAHPKERFLGLYRLGMAELEQGSELRATMYFEQAIGIVIANPEHSGLGMNHVATAAKYLAIAAYRFGEVENCCASPNPQSCIFPLLPASWHEKRAGSQKAIAHLTQLLEKIKLSPDEYGQAVWMLNLAYMTLGEHPEKVPEKWRLVMPSEQEESFQSGLASSPVTFPRFENRAASLGLDTLSHAGGSVADDFDGDGNIDIVISSWDPATPMHYFRNTGDGGFEEKEAGLAGLRGGLNLKQVDFDNDGDLDMFVGNESMAGFRAPCQLFENRDSRFYEISERVGAKATGQSYRGTL